MSAATIQANLQAATADLARVVEYRRGGSMLGFLPWVLLAVAAALALLVFGAGDGALLPAVGLLVLLPGFLLMDLWQSRASARPELILSPQGLRLETGGWGVLEVPWSSVDGIETRSFEGFALRLHGRARTKFSDVTMIRLKDGILAEARAAGRFVPGGPTLDWVIRSAGNRDWVALHHDILSLTPAEVRAPVEARWQAFRDGARPAPSAMPPLRLGGFRPTSPRLFALGTVAGLVVIGVVLANIVGLWQTEGQVRAREVAEQREQDRARMRGLTRDAEERHRQMFERINRPGWPHSR